jgi:hypothetical protein
MALQMSTINISGEIRIHVKKYFRINVSAGTIGACAVDPQVLPQRFTGNV